MASRALDPEVGRDGRDTPHHDAVLQDASVGRRVVRGGALRLGAFAATNLLAALGALFLLRYLGVDNFGRYGTVIALLAIVQGVTDAGLTVTGARELTLRDPSERRVLLAHVVGARIGLTAVGVVAAIAFSAVAGYGGNLVVGTAIAGFGVLLASVQAAMILPLSVELRNGALAFNELVRQAALVACFGILVLAGAPLLSFFAAQVVVGVVLLTIVPLLLGRKGLVRPRWSRSQLRSLARVGLPVAIAAVIAVVYFRVLVILVSLMEGPRETGLFVTSTRIFELAAAMPMLLSVLTVPVLSVAARDDDERLRYVTQRMTEVMALGGVAIAMTVAIAARPILTVFGGAQYVPAAPILQIQCLALVTVFIGSGWTSTLISMGRPRLLAMASAAGLVAVVTSGLVLIPALGGKGAAIAAVIADGVLCVSLYLALRRAGPGRGLRLRFLWRLLAATGPAVAVGVATGMPGILGAAAALVILVVMALVVRLVPSEVLDAARPHARTARPDAT